MKHFFLALLVLHLAACSSMQPVSVSHLAGQEAPTEVQIGDQAHSLAPAVQGD